MGTLEPNNKGNSVAQQVNSDGSRIFGTANKVVGNSVTVIWVGDKHQKDKYQKTEVSDTSSALSDDGKLLAGLSLLDNGSPIPTMMPTVWTGDKFDTKILLPVSPRAAIIPVLLDVISDDGKVIGGSSIEVLSVNPSTGEEVTNHNFALWSGDNFQKLTHLPNPSTVTEAELGKSIVALNQNGSIAVGVAGQTIGDIAFEGVKSFVWHGTDWKTITPLTDGVGSDYSVVAHDISDDGKIIVGATEQGGMVWSGDNWQTKHALGLTNYAQSISGDGKVVGGHKIPLDERYDIETNDPNIVNPESGWRAAVWYGDNWSKTLLLGTLRKDNKGNSFVRGLNKDGTIAVGVAVSDELVPVVGSDKEYANRATLWKIRYDDSTSTTTPTPPPTTVTPPPVTVTPPPTNTTPTPPPTSPTPVVPSPAPQPTPAPVTPTPVTPPPTTVTPTPTSPKPVPVVISKIDVENTISTINKMGQDSNALLAMQAHTLDRLQYTCHTDKGLCIGIQEDVSLAKNDTGDKRRDVGVGASVGYGFGNGLSVGVSLDHSVNRKLPTSYRHQGDNVGIGATVRYQAKNGAFGELSYAKDDYTATIVRPTLANTELGVSEATIQGESYGVKVGKNFTTNRANVRTYAGAKHIDVSRDAYTENEHTAFPISYGQMRHQATYATAGMNAKVGVTDKLSWVSNAEVAQKVSGDDPVYTASLTGVEKHDFAYQAKSAKTTGHFATGVRYQVSDNTHFEVTPYIKQHNDDETGYGVLMKVEGKFD